MTKKQVTIYKCSLEVIDRLKGVNITRLHAKDDSYAVTEFTEALNQTLDLVTNRYRLNRGMRSKIKQRVIEIFCQKEANDNKLIADSEV